MRFKKDQLILHDGDNYRCVTCDDEYAVFVKAYWYTDEENDLIKLVMVLNIR